jgi:hypothetical protein
MSTRPFLGAAQSDLSARKPYDIIDEPVGADYWGLVDGALPHCNSGVVRADRSVLEADGVAVLDELAPFSLGESASSSLGNVMRFTLNVETAAILKSATNHLYGWREPVLPSDLCLFRFDGSPWLVTVAAERLGYVELTAFEKLLLARTAPELPNTLALRAARDAVLAVFEQRYESALEPLVAELTGHAAAFLDDGRDGLVEALGIWLHASDSTRISVALDVICGLGLDEFVEEVEDLRNDAYSGRINAPSVFDSNMVLLHRWLAQFKAQLDRTLEVLRAAT